MPSLPLVHELIPAPDPWDVARKLAHLPHLCFLDSSDRHPTRGRYSYVMADPIRWITSFEDFENHFRSFANNDRSSKRDESTGFWMVDELPPFRGGLAGYFGYELNSQFENVGCAPIDEFAFPSLGIGEYRWVFAFDHHQNRAWFFNSTGNDRLLESLQQCYEEDFDFERPLNPLEKPVRLKRWFPIRPSSEVASNFNRQIYIETVRRCIDYVEAGDVFQVNLSQRLATPMTRDPRTHYDQLRRACPSPYGCYFDAGEFQILSSSPEQFLQLSPYGEVATRPIKGTRPRGKTPEEDAALLRDLTTNPKDRAENVMIVDLMRNDLGRVCEFGSVTVPKVCEVESHNYVHHLVSEVRGQLAKGKNAFDLLRACFPGGSVTGAPKVRAMEIIAELEPTSRGPYCGSMGWIGFDGAMDSNILIRTMTAGKGWLQFPVGGGIVADSDPEREYEETLHKAAGMLKALKYE